MREINGQKISGERALFEQKDLTIKHCVIGDGESALKHSERINALNSHFEWKYPFWYSSDISVKDCVFSQMARAGLWYSKNLSLENVLFEAPKTFRKSSQISLCDVTFSDASETLWNCDEVKLKNINAKGDYFAMNSQNIDIDGLNLSGNYCFDGCKNVTIKNSKLLSKDAFWNCENVIAKNCVIIGEYLGWNSKNITLINCYVQSLQGMCYIENLTMKDCVCVDTTLAFEYSSVDVSLKSEIDSVKNPKSGVIAANDIKELIMDENKIDPARTKIIKGIA